MSSIRNPDGWFINSEVFREEAKHFDKYGYFCPDPPNSLAWIEYWTEQRRRRKEGYTVGGVHITGDHYNYLNFSQIKAQEKKKNVSLEVKSRAAIKKPFFPDFWDGDYDYFHNVEISRFGCTEEYLKQLQLQYNIPTILTGGRHVTVGKSRRKGFSYKNGAIVVNRYDLIPFSINIIGAFDKKYLYPEGTMKMAGDYINFLSEHTAWGKKRDFVDKVDHKRASYKITDTNGVIIEKGFQSVIMALSFKDNPDAARGKDGTLILFEESGKFPNLKDSVKATLPTLRDGDSVTGQILIFGTGSGAEDKEDDWADFSDIFYNPIEYDMQVYDNVYDEDFYGEPCSYFFPDRVNLVGFIDEQGNSKTDEALKFRLDEFDVIKKASKKGLSSLNGLLQEYPNKPSEAFLVSTNNEFNTIILKNRWQQLIRNGLHEKLALNIEFYKDGEGINYKILTDAEPLISWKPKTNNLHGNVIIYEPPVPNAPEGTYLIGYDPIRETTKKIGISVNAAYVHKGYNDFSASGDTIVASLIGRPKAQEDYYMQLIYLAEYYNAKIMHENEVIDVRNFFRRKKKLHLLCPEPKELISLHIEDSHVAMEYGTHMVEKLKIAGLQYIKDDINEERPSGRLGGELIPCPGLCEELMKYDRAKDKAKRANYDRIMAYMQILFARQQEEENKIYSMSPTTSKRDSIIDYLTKQYAR